MERTVADYHFTDERPSDRKGWRLFRLTYNGRIDNIRNGQSVAQFLVDRYNMKGLADARAEMTYMDFYISPQLSNAEIVALFKDHLWPHFHGYEYGPPEGRYRLIPEAWLLRVHFLAR